MSTEVWLLGIIFFVKFQQHCVVFLAPVCTNLPRAGGAQGALAVSTH